MFSTRVSHFLKPLVALIFFFCLIFNAASNDYKLRLDNDIISQLYDPESSLVHFISPDSLFSVDLRSFEITSVTPLNFKDLDIRETESIIIEGEIFFIDFSGGRVFKVSEEGIVRLDKSFNHRMQSYSSIFTYNNEIYRYGGYGYWGVRKLITKYDFGTQEWQKVKVKSKIEPIGRFDPLTFVKGDNLYVIGGTGLDIYDERYTLHDIWKFNFKSSEWEDLGNINSPEFVFDTFQSTNNFFGSLGIYNFEDITFYSLDIETLTLKTFEKSHFFQKIIKGFIPFSINNDSLISVMRYRDDLFLTKLSADKILPKIRDQKPLIPQSFQLSPYLYFIPFLLAIIAIYIFFNRRKNIVIIYPNNIRKGLRKVGITEKEYLLMKYLCENPTNLDTETVLSILGEKHFNGSHNARLKNETIKSLNDKLKILVHVDHFLILDKQSQFDKRFKVYFWNDKKITLRIH